MYDNFSRQQCSREPRKNLSHANKSWSTVIMLFLFAYLGCEYGWVEFKGHCFLHVLDFVSWYDAKVRIVSHILNYLAC